MNDDSIEEIELEISNMSFKELATYAASLKGFTSVPVCTALTQRLYEISLYDNHVPKEHRKHAWNLLTTIKASVESVLKDDPASLVAYRQANSAMEAKLPLLGVGSLAWQIQEEGISSKGEATLIEFLKRPENAGRLEDFFKVVGAATAARIVEKMR